MLVVGLGNFEEKYKNTRHNIGRDSVFYCAEKFCDSKWVSDKYIKGTYKECGNTIFFLPDTFMNSSYEAVYAALEFFSFTSQEMIVVHDELDLNFGDIKIVFNKGSAGHNGVEGIINKIGSKFARIRIGIKNDSFTKENKADFVLNKFNSKEKEDINILYDKVCKTIDMILKEGLHKAMTYINK